MNHFQKIFDQEIMDLAVAAKSEIDLETISNSLPEIVEEFVGSIAPHTLQTVKNTSAKGLTERRKMHDEFVLRNVTRWQEGIDLLELQIALLVEAAQSLSDHDRPPSSEDQELLYGLIVRLHAKGCLIGSEILSLIKNGYPDGAHARWRALHEITVTAMFLSMQGETIAQRYIDHEFVEAYKGASSLKKYEARLQAKGLSEEELEESRAQYDRVLERYGKEFSGSYGWATPFLSTSKPTFFSLEEAVKLDHWRPYYKWASQNIHANVHTIRSSLGLCEAEEDILLVGSSNSGMTDPAHSTAISLSQLASTLTINSTTNIDDLVMIKMIVLLAEEIGNAFLKCDSKTNY